MLPLPVPAAEDFNPRSPHGERPRAARAPTRAVVISTHAPRTGSDAKLLRQNGVAIGISTHAPRTGSDAPMWYNALRHPDFNPRSPHGERRYIMPRRRYGAKFQPTLPARGATLHHAAPPLRREISTHAPRTGSDIRTRTQSICTSKISTHAPRTGSDVNVSGAVLVQHRFQPTLPHGERQRVHRVRGAGDVISTHAPARGATNRPDDHQGKRPHFNPRSRTGSDRLLLRLLQFRPNFNPRSRTGSDIINNCTFETIKDFNPRSRTGSDSPVTLGIAS